MNKIIIIDNIKLPKNTGFFWLQIFFSENGIDAKPIKHIKGSLTPNHINK